MYVYICHFQSSLRFRIIFQGSSPLLEGLFWIPVWKFMIPTEISWRWIVFNKTIYLYHQVQSPQSTGWEHPATLSGKFRCLELFMTIAFKNTSGISRLFKTIIKYVLFHIKGNSSHICSGFLCHLKIYAYILKIFFLFYAYLQ